MENPYEAPLLWMGILSGLIAGLIPGSNLSSHLNRIFILGTGSIMSWIMLIRFVVWSYDQSGDVADGGPKTFAALLGWLMALVWPILPVFVITVALRLLFNKLFQKGKKV